MYTVLCISGAIDVIGNRNVAYDGSIQGLILKSDASLLVEN